MCAVGDRAKFAIFIAVLVDSVMLAAFFKGNLKYGFEARQKMYFNSKGWRNYAELYWFEDEEMRIIADSGYCDNVRKVRGDIDYSEVYNRVIYSDYKPGSLVKSVLASSGHLVHPLHHVSTEGLVDDEYLSPEITLFYHKSDFHNKQMIGAYFLCENQRYNHIPGNFHLVYKDLLTEHAKAYAKFYNYNKTCFDYSTFLPDTYDLSNYQDCIELFSLLEESLSVKWIKKKSRDSHNSEGIEILHGEKLKQLMNDLENGERCGRYREKFLVQRYIENPLLIHGKKFDFRVYMLIANMSPLVILYHEGFLRVTLKQYNSTSTDFYSHITNTAAAIDYISSGNLSNDLLESQMWTYAQLQAYLIENEKISDALWIQNYLTPHMKKKMIHMVRMLYHELLPHPGVFELFGIDFILDDQMNLWLLEANKSPAMMATNEIKGKILRGIVKDVVEIEYDLLQGKDVQEAVSRTGFEFVYNGFVEGYKAYFNLIPESCL